MKGFLPQHYIQLEDFQSPILRNINKPPNQVLFAVAGGLGDRIVMHPIISYFRKTYPNRNITVVSNVPFLYTNIPNILNLDAHDDYDFTKNHVYATHMPEHFLTYQIINPHNLNFFDYVSITTLQSTLPSPQDKIIQIPLCDDLIKNSVIHGIKEPYILFHFSDTEPVRHIPPTYVEQLLPLLANNIPSIPIILIGKTKNDIGQNGLVYKAPKHPRIIDLRDQTTVAEAVYLTQKAHIIIGSDSFPIHSGASIHSKAYIFYFSHFKNNQYLGHYRVNNEGVIEFAWRTKNLVPNPRVELFLDPEFRFYANPDSLNNELRRAYQSLPKIGDVIDQVKEVL